MADDKTTEVIETPQVKQVPKEEFEEKEVFDSTEAAYGDPAKAKKTIKVKKEPKAIVTDDPQVTVEVKKTDELPATPKVEKVLEKKIETEIKADDFFDPLDTIAKKPVVKDALKETTQVAKTPEQLHEEIIAPETKRQAEAYKKLTATTTGKFLADLAEKGEDVMAAIYELQPRDYRGMPETDLVTSYFQKIEGLKGEELQNAIDEHNDLPEGGNQRRKNVREYRDTLDYDQQKRTGQYQEILNSNKNKVAEAIPRFHEDADKEVDEVYAKKGAYGIKLTSDQATSLKESTKTIFARLMNPDGTVNAKQAAYYSFMEGFIPTVLKNNYLKHVSEGREEVLNVVHQPDRMETSIANPRNVVKEDEVARINRLYGGTPTKP